MKKLYFLGVLLFLFTCLGILPISLIAQVNETENNDTPGAANGPIDIPTASPPGQIAGDFVSGTDIDYWEIVQTTGTYELVKLGASIFTVILEEYDPSDFTTTLSTLTLGDGDEFTLTQTNPGSEFFFRLSGATGVSYEFALASGNGTVGDAVFPVEWLSFEAHTQDTRVMLLWSTASEENNQGFEVERSEDALHWEQIGFVEGAGSTQEIQEYQFVDKRPLMGFNYYRLKQVDFNGDFDYSAIREITLGSEELTQVPSLYPNPVINRVSIGPFVGDITLRDLAGRVILQKKLHGVWQEMDLNFLPEGTYLLHFQGLSGNSHYTYLSKN